MKEKGKRLTSVILFLILSLTMSFTAIPVFAENLNRGENNIVPEVLESFETDNVDLYATEKDENIGLETIHTEEVMPSVSPREVEATANPTLAASESASFTFVRRDESELAVNFEDVTSPLGLNGTPAEVGVWIFKSYFIGWSDNKNYAKEGTGHLFYETATVQDVLATGLTSGTKLYALYGNTGTMNDINTLTKVTINNNVSAEDFVSPGNPQKTGDETTAIYETDAGDYEIKVLESDFSMNPFISAAIYKDSWVGALDNGSSWNQLKTKKGNVTVVDLHVHLDNRLVLPDEFELTFHSYTFRPFYIFSAMKADGSPVADNEDYLYIGVDQTGDGNYEGVMNRIENNNPDTTFRTKSYILDANGNKVPVYDYVIRTRTRVGYDLKGNKISPVTMEQIQSGMKLSLKGATFKVPNNVAKEIADKNAEPIKISGLIDGLVKGRYWGSVNSEEEILDFKKLVNPTVTFMNESTNYANVEVQKGQAIDTDELNDQSMPPNPTKEKYTFKEWNTKEDGSGDKFTGTSLVNEDMTVYAIYNLNATIINHAPIVEVIDKTITVGDELDLKTLITKAEDKEDGPNLVDLVVIDKASFDNTKVGKYEITFSLTDKGGARVTKKAIVTVEPKEKPPANPLDNKPTKPSTIIKTPITDDTSNLWLYSAVLGLSLALVVSIIFNKRRNNE